jgi:hypothetical protein
MRKYLAVALVLTLLAVFADGFTALRVQRAVEPPVPKLAAASLKLFG